MNKHLKKFILISIFGIPSLIILLLYMLWFYAPQVPLERLNGPAPSGDDAWLLNLYDLSSPLSTYLPIPFYFDVLRSHIQSSEKARFVSLRDLRYSGYRRNSFCSNEDFRKVRYIHSFYITKQDDCSSFPEGYIAIGYTQFGYDGGHAGNYYIEELYKKYDDGRLELVISAKKFRPIPA